jgi:hypothetical protein
MALSHQRIADLVMRVQRAFIDSPEVRVRLAEAPGRFGIDRDTCKAILETLIDAHVLTLTPSGAYTRRFPHRQPGASARRAQAA